MAQTEIDNDTAVIDAEAPAEKLEKPKRAPRKKAAVKEQADEAPAGEAAAAPVEEAPERNERPLTRPRPRATRPKRSG